MARNSSQRGDTLKEGLIGLSGVGPVDLRTLDDPDKDLDINMPALLRRLLVAGTEGKTWAQWLLEGLVIDALEGSPRAVQEVLDRTEQRRPTGNSAHAALPRLGNQAVTKILEVLNGSPERPASN